MSVVDTFRAKIEKNGYKRSVEVERGIASGELQVLPRAYLWNEKWRPYRNALEKLGELMRDVPTGRGVVIAKIFESISHLQGMIPNTYLAVAKARQAVMALRDLGVDEEKAVSIVSEATGLSKGLIRGTRAGGGGGRGGGGGAPI